jgi:hypothetical protein
MPLGREFNGLQGSVHVYSPVDKRDKAKSG